MKTTIDKAGRIVVPKAMRDQLGLVGGSEVEIALADGRIEIEPATTSSLVVKREEGRLVAVAAADVPPLTAAAVRDLLESIRR